MPTVLLGTSARYAVLGASTVTNINSTVLDGSLGLWPGTSITGFPPGIVLPPGTIDTTNAAAQQAQADLTTAYVDAAGRPINGTTTSDLTNLRLVGGVYSGPGKSPLSLTGPLVLDGQGDPSTVFIFQTNSTLITGSASTVTLVNGAQECNVFWQVGSSATLGTNSVFRGNILALASITVDSNVTVHGRALARNGAVTLDDSTFVRPTCDTTPATTPPTIALPVTTATTDPSATTTTTVPATTTTVPAATTTTVPAPTATTTVPVADPPAPAPGAPAPAPAPGAPAPAPAPGAPAPAPAPAPASSASVSPAAAAPLAVAPEVVAPVVQLPSPPVLRAPTAPGATTAGTPANGSRVTASARGPELNGVTGLPRTGGAPLRQEAGSPSGAAVLLVSLLGLAWLVSAVRSRSRAGAAPPAEPENG